MKETLVFQKTNSHRTIFTVVNDILRNNVLSYEVVQDMLDIYANAVN